MRVGFVGVTRHERAYLTEMARDMVDMLGRLGEVIGSTEFAMEEDRAAEIATRIIAKGPSAIITFIGSGGTERLVLAIARQAADIPLIIVAHGRENSLAASLEVIARLRLRDVATRLVYFTKKVEEAEPSLRVLLRALEASGKLKGSRLGIVGFPSPWLVASTTNFQLVEDRFGLEVRLIPLQELCDRYERIPVDRAREEADSLMRHVKGVAEVTEEGLLKAARLYLAGKSLVEDYGLNAITVGCFDLIPKLGCTSCYMFSRLLDEGVVAGCEGDINATLTMMIARYLTGRPAWMANPTSLDVEANAITLAHCTVAARIAGDIESIGLRSHFESGFPVGIRGAIKADRVTLARLGGLELDKLMIIPGTIKEVDMGLDHVCRTQAVVKIDGKVSEYLERSLGNHLVLIPGDTLEELLEACRFLHLQPILIK